MFPRGARKLDLIVTFLSLLELLRLQMITAWQGQRFAGIRITRRVQPVIDASKIPSEVEPEIPRGSGGAEVSDPSTPGPVLPTPNEPTES